MSPLRNISHQHTSPVQNIAQNVSGPIQLTHEQYAQQKVSPGQTNDRVRREKREVVWTL